MDGIFSYASIPLFINVSLLTNKSVSGYTVISGFVTTFYPILVSSCRLPHVTFHPGCHLMASIKEMSIRSLK